MDVDTESASEKESDVEAIVAAPPASEAEEIYASTACQTSPAADNDQSCPICFEPWTNYGPHHLVALFCGHLFGRSCVEAWLKENKNGLCPICKRRFRKKDIRKIFAMEVKVEDVQEREKALEELKTEKGQRAKAEEEAAQAVVQLQAAKLELNRLRAELHMERVKVLSMREHMETKAVQGSQESLSQDKGGYAVQSVTQVAQEGARVMAVNTMHGFVAVSKPSPVQGLFSKYGIGKVSMLDGRSMAYVPIHQDTIRDCKFNNTGDNLILTASLDKQLIVTDLSSNGIALRNTCPTPVWSCCWDNQSEFFVYCGLVNGAVLAFDTRSPDTVLQTYRMQGVYYPVVSVVQVPDAAALDTPSLGLLTGTLGGSIFFEQRSRDECIPHRIHFEEGAITCLSYEPDSRCCLISQRPNQHYKSTRHSIVNFQKVQTENTFKFLPLGECRGGNKSSLLTRSLLCHSGGANNRFMVAAGDEESASTVLWDVNSGREIQRIRSRSGPVLDLAHWSHNGTSFLASLTESKLSIAKWTV